MGTFELLIVFAALMAVISLVAIAIDWVGRPLKNRRFIPRIYRYEDEVEPAAVPMLQPAPANPPLQGPPIVVTAPPVAAPPMMAPPVAAPPPASMAPASPPIVKPEVTTVAAELAPAPPAVGATSTTHPDSVSRPPAPSTSAFQDTIGTADEADASGPPAASPASPSSKPRGIAETVHTQSAASWAPGMPLDARVNDANPSPDEKAQRFWMATGDAVGTTTHFDDVNLARMAQGKAPTRRNPRTGDVEAMELVGLRAASHRSDVRMKWPDETVDPWSAS